MAPHIVAVPIVAVPIVAVPIVAVPIVALPIVAVPIVAVPFVAVPIAALITCQVSSSTFFWYEQCRIWSKAAGPVEGGFEEHEACDSTCHCVRLLSELECGYKGLPFIDIREVGNYIEFPPRVFNHDVAYCMVIDYLVLG